MKKYSWSFNECDDVFEGNADTLEECYEQAKEKDPTRKYIFIGENIKAKLDYGACTDIIIEDLRDQAFDECGEASEYWLDDLDDEVTNKLRDILVEGIGKWIKENSLDMLCNKVENIKPYEVK